MGGVYYILQDSTGFDNLMHGKSPKGNQKQRSLEDFGKSQPSPESVGGAARANDSQLSLFNVSLRSTRSRSRVDRVWKGEAAGLACSLWKGGGGDPSVLHSLACPSRPLGTHEQGRDGQLFSFFYV